MSKFFKYYPQIYYTNANNNISLDVVTNILARFSFENSLKENSSTYYEYDVRDGDTPEMIAKKYYGNVERNWIVLMFNNIIDPLFDWVMDGQTLNDYIDKKYSANGGIYWAKNNSNVKSYYKVITRVSGYDGTTISEKIEITSEEYANTGTSSETFKTQDGLTTTQTITTEFDTYYDYEFNLNESKRTIKLLKPEFVEEVEKEFRNIIK